MCSDLTPVQPGRVQLDGRYIVSFFLNIEFERAEMVKALAFPPMWPGFESRTGRHMWVEFVVGSRPCSEGFFSGFLPQNQHF